MFAVKFVALKNHVVFVWNYPLNTQLIECWCINKQLIIYSYEHDTKPVAD